MRKPVLLMALALAWSGATLAQNMAATQAPDNTGVNGRDQLGSGDTAQAQSNAKADLELLAAVRRSVVQDKSLSTTAHNVKILAANGAVTLRGPVRSDAEKARVEALARQVAGVTSVQNQLDVKTH